MENMERGNKKTGDQAKKRHRLGIKKYLPFYIMFLPVLIYYVVFRYVPLDFSFNYIGAKV